MKNIRTLIIGSILVLAAVIAGYLFAYRGSVVLMLAPDTSEMVVDESSGRRVVHDNDRIYLTPGKHTLTFYRTDFSIERVEVTVKSLKSQDQLVALLPLTDATKKVMQTSKNQERLQTYSARKKNTLFSLLPIGNADYRIESCPSLKVSLDTRNRALCFSEIIAGGTEKAKNYLLSIGYDPSHYQVYTGDNTAVKVVYKTDAYTVSYPTNEKLGKPLLVLFLKEPIPEPIIAQKDAMLADLAKHGYNPDDYYLYFLNPQLVRFSTLPGSTELFD